MAVATAVAAALVTPAAAQGTVTVGSNLNREPGVHIDCGQPGGCTAAQQSLAIEFQAPAGLTSPVNGSVVRWRIRADSVPGAPAATALRVIRPLGGGLFTGAGTSANVVPPVGTTYNTQLPIELGDLIGVDCCDQGFSGHFVNAGGSAPFWASPLLADGGSGRAPSFTNPGIEVSINADIEPTSAFTILKAKPKPGGKVAVTAELRNPGTLAAGDKGAKLTAAAAGKKTKLLKTQTLAVTAPGQVTMTVKATKAARSLLTVAGSLKAKLKLAFTPSGGSPATQIVKVKLKA